MNKNVSFEGIGYVAATFPVNATTKTYLVANHTNAKTGNVDVNGMKLAVKLDEEGKVGFGAAEPTSADALLGILVDYEMDGFASVQIEGCIDDVPTAAVVTGGRKSLAVNNKGEVVVVSGAREVSVAKPSTSQNKKVSIIL